MTPSDKAMSDKGEELKMCPHDLYEREMAMDGHCPICSQSENAKLREKLGIFEKEQKHVDEIFRENVRLKEKTEQLDLIVSSWKKEEEMWTKHNQQLKRGIEEEQQDKIAIHTEADKQIKQLRREKERLIEALRRVVSEIYGHKIKDNCARCNAEKVLSDLREGKK